MSIGECRHGGVTSPPRHLTGERRKRRASMKPTKKVPVLAARPDATGLRRASGDAAPKHPGTEEGAKALLGAFLKADADAAALTKALRPATADFAAAFEGDFAATAEKMYAEGWESGKIVIGRKP